MQTMQARGNTDAAGSLNRKTTLNLGHNYFISFLNCNPPIKHSNESWALNRWNL